MNNDNTQQLKGRIEALESSLAFLQHDFDAQNETILLQTQQINRLESTLKKLVGQMEDLKSKEEDREEGTLALDIGGKSSELFVWVVSY